MAALRDLVGYSDRLLQVGEFKDYCPNGLQVEGRGEVQRLVSGVTASRALIESAIEAGADALLVHHGYFWRGEDPAVVGMKRDRLARLLGHGVSLLVYHLPLDAHPTYGNNAGLAARLGLSVDDVLGEAGLLFYGTPAEPLPAAELRARIEQALGRAPTHVAGGPDPIRRIGWCTGAAQGMIEQAADAGLDAFVSGEISEPTTHVARERGLHYFAAGHHATERDGVRLLGEHLAACFDLAHRFIDIDNPA